MKNISLKDVMNKMSNQTSPINVVRNGNPHALALWNARNVESVGQKLQFSVGDNEILITYNTSSKDYFITFFKMENNRRKIINNKKNVKKENLYKELESILGEI